MISGSYGKTTSSPALLLNSLALLYLTFSFETALRLICPNFTQLASQLMETHNNESVTDSVYYTDLELLQLKNDFHVMDFVTIVVLTLIMAGLQLVCGSSYADKST